MDFKKGIEHLRKSDNKLAKIIEEYPEPKISKTKFHFQSLVRNIIYQQLSTKSAFAIHNRFKKLFSSSRSFNLPDNLNLFTNPFESIKTIHTKNPTKNKK